MLYTRSKLLIHDGLTFFFGMKPITLSLWALLGCPIQKLQTANKVFHCFCNPGGKQKGANSWSCKQIPLICKYNTWPSSIVATYQKRLSSVSFMKARAMAFCSGEWLLEKLTVNFLERRSIMNWESHISSPLSVIQGTLPLGPNSYPNSFCSMKVLFEKRQ